MKAQRTIDAGTAGEDPNVIEMAVSSEAPYERWFGIEILRHTADAVDLSRMNDGRHPLLLNHNTDQQIGVIQRAWLDGDKKVRASARFSKSRLGQEIQQDVADGVRTLVSVGYMVNEVEEQKKDADGNLAVRMLSGDEFEREMRSRYGENFYRAGPCAERAKDPPQDPPTYVVTRWQPFEASVVPVPADVDVGVGRSAGAAQPPAKQEAAEKRLEAAQGEPEASPKTPTPERIVIMSTEVKAPTPEELERARTSGILQLGDAYSKYVAQKDISEAVRSGKSVEQFKDVILAKMESKHTDTSETHIGMSRGEVQRYSLAKALVASITGDWRDAGLERAASEAVAKKFGITPEGFFVPFDAWSRDFNLGTSSEAGNLRATDLRTDLYVDALRNAIVMSRLGVRIIPGLTGNVDMPRKATVSSLGMLAEIGSATESNPTTAKVTLSPKRVGSYIQVSKQALIQSAIALEPMLRDDLLQGAGVLIESQMINGVGSNNEMTGIRNTASIGTVTAGANGATLAWSHLVDLESACANSNAEPDVLAGYLINTKARGRGKQVTKSTYLPFLWQDGPTPFNGYRVAVSNNVPSNLTKGTSTTICSAALFASDWSMGVLGLFGAPDITVDPYSLAATGQVQITLNQFADFGVRQPAAFAKIEDLLT